MATRAERQADIPAAAKPAQPTQAAPGAVERAISASAVPLLTARPREESLRLLAYSYYEERGRLDGYALEDWLKAEAALNSVNEAP
jgi:hypothetical protein